MGLFGGSSSSSSYQTTTNHNSQITIDGDNGGLVLSNVKGSNITVTDHEAIDKAFFLASQIIQANAEVIDTSYTAINDNLTQSLLFVDEQNQVDGGLTLDILKPIIYGVSAVALAYFTIGKK